MNDRAHFTADWKVHKPDLIPTERYFRPEFQKLEDAHLWKRAWQMACRLEEIPNANDFVEYTILGASVIIVRQADGLVKAFENACRHRGVKLCLDRGTARGGIGCPFHGWHWNVDGTSRSVFQPALFNPDVLHPEDINLIPIRSEIWGGCVFITFDKDAPDLRATLGAFGPVHEVRQIEDLRTRWWISVRIPANWKLVVEAFLESYHVLRTHPQLVSMLNTSVEDMNRMAEDGMVGTQSVRLADAQGGNAELVKRQLAYFHLLHEGMGKSLMSAREVEVAERIKDEVALPDDPGEAMNAWRQALHQALYDDALAADLPIFPIHDLPLDDASVVRFSFPNFFMLSPLTAASSYRMRPIGPEETLMEIWALERFPRGEEPSKFSTPVPLAHNDPAIPEVPAQDFSNLPRQQLGIHAPNLRHLRLAQHAEGMISNFERLVDGYLEGWSTEQLLDGLCKVNGSIDQPIKPMGQ